MSEHDFEVVADLAEELGHGDLASVVRALDPWRAKCLAVYFESLQHPSPEGRYEKRERLFSDLTNTLDELHGIALLKQSRPTPPPWERLLLDVDPVAQAVFDNVVARGFLPPVAFARIHHEPPLATGVTLADLRATDYPLDDS